VSPASVAPERFEADGAMSLRGSQVYFGWSCLPDELADALGVMEGPTIPEQSPRRSRPRITFRD
jgi:hypothetical protein